VPETASYPKIAQIAACGADVVTIPGTRQDVAEEALRQSAEIFYASHNWQPMFVEGVKTLAYELWEQLAFTAPDNVVVPLGYGSSVLGCERGFDELVRRGEIERGPRPFGVQAANCAPTTRPSAPASSTRAHDDRADDRPRGSPAKPTRVAGGAPRRAPERGPWWRLMRRRS
jgi:threonine synthase